MFGDTDVICRDGKHKLSMRVPVDQDGLCALGQEFRALGQSYGMEYFLVSTFPKADNPEFGANLVFSNWPADLREACDANDNFALSRLVGHLKESIRPVFSTECLFAGGPSEAQDGALARTFCDRGFKGSLAFSMHDSALNHFIFVFSGSRTEMAQDEIATLYFGCMELLDTCFGRFRTQEGPREKLSARELECLRWSAAGKSSDEIAIILNISSHTVVSYLKSAMRKLDSVNRMQAVARACRFRLL